MAQPITNHGPGNGATTNQPPQDNDMTQDQYDDAARAVHAALQERNATSNRRLHVDRYKPHAARVLNMRAVYPARWAEVIAAGARLRLFKVDRKTLKKPFFVALKPRTTAKETPERVRLDLGLAGHSGESLTFKTYGLRSVSDDTFDEDTSDDPTVEHARQVEPPPATGKRGIVLVRYPKSHYRHEPSGGKWLTIGNPLQANDTRLEATASIWRLKGAQAVIAYFTK